ncbi:hypothetical protein DSO57_1022651 [Entomophthora muscae]|uniref:Uncharacterized protein n=1 Tax=Entomophthora muscae TaxID=34485 RepID=A0ACC2T3G1_9FUNG|nr:hypothetical protein DSO57_1022651 [Entomophthora muscae]
MTPPLTPQPDCPLEPTAAAETTSTQLFGVLYITLIGLVDSMVPNSRPWSLLRQSVSYIIKLAPILWWALPASLAVPHPEPPKAPTYDWLPDTRPENRKPSEAFFCFEILYSPDVGESKRQVWGREDRMIKAFALIVPFHGRRSPTSDHLYKQGKLFTIYIIQ